MRGRQRFTPLAITGVDAASGCVGSITEHGEWLRPAVVARADVEGPTARYRYGAWYEADVEPLRDERARPEDHVLVAGPRPVAAVSADPLGLAPHAASVAAAFENGRSLGLVEVDVDDLYVGVSTGRRQFLRARFRDRTGECFDWIIPDLAFGALAWPHVQDEVLDRGWASAALHAMARVCMLFTVGLTHPNGRFPGRFRGCHPLVVGVHSRPDYIQLIGGSLGRSRGAS